ncbi:DNA utilization protein HofO [Enterobacter hormaechei]|uniref:HofO family protein n=1 Tax=Enterobacter hormaechei TaxID=158836 RepID=UPI0011DD24F6|nr:DNA utilization protein HofO [Enterobacter hormaechei]TXU04386.1 DNA utilization protein HofO [Enterobacter hormaechei]
MGIWYQRWTDARPSRRVLCWLIASGLIALAIWGLLLRPAALRYADIQAQAISAKRISASLWPGAGRRVVVTQVTPSHAFSPLAFQHEDARLVYWKPQQSGGELALDALWDAVPALFSRLALENVRVSAFSITPQGKRLRLSMQLEIGHAQ